MWWLPHGKTKHLALTGPFGGQVAETSYSHAPGQDTFDRCLDEPHDEITSARQIPSTHNDAAEEPRDLLAYQIDHHIDALLTRLTRNRLIDCGRLDLARP